MAKLKHAAHVIVVYVVGIALWLGIIAAIVRLLAGK